MAGETIAVYGSTVNMVTSGASITDTTFSTTVAAAITDSHPLCDVVFTGTFASAPAANSIMKLYRRDLNIFGTNDEAVPDSAYRRQLVGIIGLDNATTNYINVPSVPLSPDCEFYIENVSGQTLNSGWTLDVKPFGYGVAP